MNEEIRAFKCQCGSIFEICDGGDQYLTLYGNLLTGESGGLIGGNLPEYSKEIAPQRKCRACFLKAIAPRGKNRSLTETLPKGDPGSGEAPGQHGQQGLAGQQGFEGFAGAPGD
jgi:hypothetical protein